MTANKINKKWLIIIALIIISPVFGVILAGKIGYHEPLDIAAKKLGLTYRNTIHYHTPFQDYTFPGTGPVLGYILAGGLGVIIILIIGYIIRKMVSTD